MKDFLSEQDRALLQRHGLIEFEALWALGLNPVDAPNLERGGVSSVARLELEDQCFYLKRQVNHLTRSPLHPFGEPTFARELRNIQFYQQHGIPALEAVYYGERKVRGSYRAILMTRALDGWRDLGGWLDDWESLAPTQRDDLMAAVGTLARQLHAAGRVHGCLYPKHIFLRERADGFDARLIDLEKTRRLWFGQRDRVRDLEPLIRRASAWSPAEIERLLSTYLDGRAAVPAWLERLVRRRRSKEAR